MACMSQLHMFSTILVQNLTNNFTEQLHHRKPYQILSGQQPSYWLQQNFNEETSLFDQKTTT